jgi:carbonyl reductase 1
MHLSIIQGIAVYACCPGWCQTDMSSQSGPKTAADGADTPVWIALQPLGSIASGGFFGERQELNWGSAGIPRP